MVSIGSWRTTFNASTLVLLLLFTISSGNIYSQETESEAAKSMGVGMKSRFASGATPIQIERTSIVPGTPMSVNSTMNNIISSNGNGSFGGILARYDTSTFGKFFGTGSMAPRANSSRINALDNLEQGDNEVENVETERMYPPRLSLDFNEYPTRSLETRFSQSHLQSLVANAISRFKFDKEVESIRVECRDGVVYLTGRAKSPRMIRLIENVVSIQGGVDSIVNEIVALEPDTNNIDVFGRPITTKPSK